jgi:hypothetical protein
MPCIISPLGPNLLWDVLSIISLLLIIVGLAVPRDGVAPHIKTPTNSTEATANNQKFSFTAINSFHSPFVQG